MTRKGAGILVGVRAMEWKQILIEDVFFYSMKYKTMDPTIMIKLRLVIGWQIV